jgi:hypothetical protein
MNIAETIAPKSDQLNSDDLIAGPKTIRITGIQAGSTPEQPVFIKYEGGDGRPWKPCKSMRRVLCAIWGADGAAYTGRRLTLFCDPSVRFGGEQTGGIRISHASHIAEAVSLSLTVTRGKRKPFTVLPLPDEAPPPDVATLEAIGETKAREGSESLRAWWVSVPACPAKKEVGASKLPSWKELASAADAAGKA